MAIQHPKTISLKVARWGNSLAVRLPVDYVRRARVTEGETIVLTEASDGTLSLNPRKPFDRKAFVERLQKQRSKMKMGWSVIEELRKNARY